MTLKRFLIAAGLILVLAVTSFGRVSAQTPEPDLEGYPVYIYFFWGVGCPHCAVAKPYFEGLAAKYPFIVLRSYEVYGNPEGQKVLSAMAANYGFEVSGVPTTLIGPYYVVGYTEEWNQDIERVVVECYQNGCLNAGAGIIKDDPVTQAPAILATATPVITETFAALAQNPTLPAFETAGSQSVHLPFVGSIDLEGQSLALSTALIAFVDGFNPCSLWVLSILMALVLHTGSRKKVLVIGLVFLTVTAGIYALFIAGLFSILSLVSYLGWVQAVVAGISFLFGAVNIKDYFWYREGVSLTISDERKPGIFQNIRRVIAVSDSIWGLVGATVVMAAGVSLVEFSCTAGFPVLWTNLLTAHGVSTRTFIALLLLYMLIYQADEIVIFGSVVATLRASRLEEKQGRVLKLFGGMLMLALSVVMLVKPTLMNELGSSLIVFGLAFSLAVLILIIHRKILPQLGIWIGNEELEKKPVQPTGQKQEE